VAPGTANAQPHGVKVATHNWCGPVVTRAASHACAAMSNLLYQEFASGSTLGMVDTWENDLLDPPTVVQDGHIVLSERPGLGSKLNEKAVSARLLS